MEENQELPYVLIVSLIKLNKLFLLITNILLLLQWRLCEFSLTMQIQIMLTQLEQIFEI